MRWRGGRRSRNIEDRRGARGGKLLGGGIGTIAIILIAMYFGVDPAPLLDATQGGVSSEGTRPSAEDLRDDPLADMVSVVVADTEDVWTELFAAEGRRYQQPTLVLFSGSTRSACGLGQAAMGPFYCPADQKAYIDLSFYDQMRTRFRAPGDFAQAYVIAHEIGHHVQNLLGISGQVHEMKGRVSQPIADASKMPEAHAHRARNILEAGDVEEALNAASAIGDDTLQRQSQGTVVPESFTHGTSAQRQRWFRTGLESGDPDRCDTFGVDRL